MSSVLVMAVVGAVFGLGLFAIWFGATQPARSLAEVSESLQYGSSAQHGSGPALWRTEMRRSRRRWGAALELCEQTPEEFVRGRLVLTVEFAALPLVVWTGGVVGVLPKLASGEVWVAVALVAGAAGWALSGVILRREANERAEEFNSGLAGFAELIALLVAGGAGLETATEEAAKTGSGQVYRHLQAAVAASAARREPPWTAMQHLGERLELDDLVQFAQSMALASDGTQVSDALVERAAAARERDLSRQLAQAEATSEAMVVPVTLMLAGVFILIGFPVVVALTTL